MTDPLLGPAQVRRLAAELGLHPRKSLGQNFVIDPNTIRRIVRLAQLPPAATVLEIGPGLGSLTLGLLEAGHPVTAVEVDPVLAERLPATVAEHLPQARDRLIVVPADAVAIGPECGAPDAVVSNLPYNVAVPVLLHALATYASVRRSLVLVQQEVADRLAAPPGSRVYGIPSVKAAWFGDVRRVGAVPPKVFWPVPRVDSGLVAVTARPPGTDPVPDPWDQPVRRRVFAAVDRTFATRRKTLRSSLSAWLGSEEAAAVLAAAHVEATLRPEQLGLAEFVRLGSALPDGAAG